VCDLLSCYCRRTRVSRCSYLLVTCASSHSSDDTLCLRRCCRFPRRSRTRAHSSLLHIIQLTLNQQLSIISCIITDPSHRYHHRSTHNIRQQHGQRSIRRTATAWLPLLPRSPRTALHSHPMEAKEINLDLVPRTHTYLHGYKEAFISLWIRRRNSRMA